MIGLLRGIILHKQPPSLLLDVNGVGYEIDAPMSTFYQLPADDSPVTLYTHLAIRDDAHVLFGFATPSDRTLFRALLKVNGVGGKMALAILSGMTAEEFAQCVQAGDVAALTRVPGVGKKTAERLLIEMRDRLPAIASSDGAQVVLAQQPASPSNDALDALLALGYKLAEAQRMLKTVDQQNMNTEDIIRQALQSIK
jgi:Holliday junction DNA helicase RuvA